MLSQVLQEISQFHEPVSLAVLSQRLGVERSALEEMLAYWVRKGRLKDFEGDAAETGMTCASGSCGSSCTGMSNCAFIARVPKMYAIAKQPPIASQPAVTTQKENL